MQRFEPAVTVTDAPAKQQEAKTIHSIPCKFEYTGPANVQSYFHIEQNGDDGSTVKASLRGRGLEGATVSLPTGYELAVLKPRSGQGNSLDVEATTRSVQLWEWDRVVGERSALNRAFAYLPIAEALAADD